MEMNIIKEQQNALFSRKEIQAIVVTSVTPSKEEAVKMIADKFSVDSALVRIRDIKGKFGKQEFVITADVYDSLEEFRRIVKKTKQEIEAEKKAAEEKKKAEEEARKAAEEAAVAEKEAGEEEAQSE